MDLQQLRYVIALSKELNFNRAAARVGISQPTLSQQIKKLEDELGSPLFERSPHAVRLTSAGEKFLPNAIGALESLKKGVEDVKTEKDELEGVIHLGFIPTVGPYLLPLAIQVLAKKAPKLQLKLHEETTSVLLESLKSGNIDLGLLALPIDEDGIVARSLGKEDFYLAMAKHHPLAKKKYASQQDLERAPLLVLKEGHCFRDQALAFCKENKRNAQVVFEGSSLVSVMNLAASGKSITFVPHMAVKKASHSGLKYLPFKSPKPTRDIGIIWRITTSLSRSQRFLIDVLEREFHRLYS